MALIYLGGGCSIIFPKTIQMSGLPASGGEMEPSSVKNLTFMQQIYLLYIVST